MSVVQAFVVTIFVHTVRHKISIESSALINHPQYITVTFERDGEDSPSKPAIYMHTCITLVLDFTFS